MKNGDMLAMPFQEIKTRHVNSAGFQEVEKWKNHTGLTKREYAAIEIAKGLASATNQDGTWTTDADSVSTMAIEYADALLAGLEKDQ